MPPRCNATPGAAADTAPRDALTVLPLVLPRPLATRIWGVLPCDVRLRCREVCPAWRDALAEPRLWTELDLTKKSGAVVCLTPALLRAAAARAGGRLERLFVTDATDDTLDLARLEEIMANADALDAALLEVFAANADALQLLRLERGHFTYERLESLMRAVPRQCVVEADAEVEYGYAEPMLRNEPPFQAVRFRSLHVDIKHMFASDVAADLKSHSSLRELTLYRAPLDTFAALDAVVDAALALRLTKLALDDCRVVPAAAVALPRLLNGDALQEFRLSSGQLLDAHVAPLLADALRSNRTLTSLTLDNMGLWDDEVDAACAALFSSFVGHASLASIFWRFNHVRSPNATAAASAQLAALVAANSPQLRSLDVSRNGLYDDGLGPLMDALPRNTHLRELVCSGMSAAFVREQLMPALAANTSLQTLDSGNAKADAFIKRRAAAMAAAARA